MAIRLSRRKMAAFVADKLLAGVPTRDAFKEVAAHLIDTRRTREIELLVRDVEDILAQRGMVVADVTTAHPLSDSIKADIRTLVGATSLQLRASIDASVLGGVRIDVPGKRFDGTIQRKLIALKAKQL
jgi:F-type H+-transporting ATPase subunit delta